MRPEEFSYILPDEKIARFPLENRDLSRLLLYSGGEITHHVFRQIQDLLDSDHLLVFNDTRVIPARLHFYKHTGARIEIFILDPVFPSTNVYEALTAQNACTWFTIIGNLKKWHEGELLSMNLPGGILLQAELTDRESRQVKFTWNQADFSFQDILARAGKIPLPPYLNREADENDVQTYQTVYAQNQGAVAAPTAGLHFTPEVLSSLRNKGTGLIHLTLHVGAGTFQPLKSEQVKDHDMHKEQISVTAETLQHLIRDQRHRIAVGTTSLRSLESLYWFGVRLMENPEASFFIPKLYPYSDFSFPLPNRYDALLRVQSYMQSKGLHTLVGETEILIMPGYIFRNIDSLITNFHQPGSTLMVLVAALIGNDWKKVYQTALDENYRFLSYGDSSWLKPA